MRARSVAAPATVAATDVPKATGASREGRTPERPASQETCLSDPIPRPRGPCPRFDQPGGTEGAAKEKQCSTPPQPATQPVP